MLARVASGVLRQKMGVRAISEASRNWATSMNKSLNETDPELEAILEKEKQRQRESLVLIASENFTSKSVCEALGSVMSNKYSEGYPGARYYGGNEFIDMAENLCIDRALTAFRLNSEEWGVNVQTLSGSPANFQAYTAVLQPHDRILSLDLPHGGHLSHGFQTPKAKVSKVSLFFESMPYRLNEETGFIDYDEVERSAELFRPKLIVAGASAYARKIDYARMRKIADKVGAYLLADMAHISGLVAAGVMPSPFDYCDIVTTTTHKTLRGPRGAMIFFKKGVKEVKKDGTEVKWDLEEKINSTVFPGLQGGPHNHTISALATALKQCTTPEYAEYQTQVLMNAQVMSEGLQKKGYKLVSDGTDNHLILVDLKPMGVDGAAVELILEKASIAVNKNTVPGDKSALRPGGLRIGSPALTTRGFTEEDFEKVVDFIDRGVKIAMELSEKVGKNKPKKFKKTVGALKDGDIPELDELKNEVNAFASEFPGICF
eukprot:TRINITY_DN32_c0_g2_i1.p1 TRINITY_DN32_c0_g2~~TRINITY_DN32_c0_g2_i1.p1  ORF type:complete len:489 (+),score=176.56 TRINITY_DN32_c0_g2_i1:99-1565(+)